MVELQRVAWDNGIEGLFPCSRDPVEPPPRLGSDPSDAELLERNRLAAMAHRDREINRPRRVKIERAIQLAEEVAGTVAFLLGPDAGFINGEIIDVNGGARPD